MGLKKKRRKQIARPPRDADELFRERVERFQSECAWCERSIGEDEPVYGVEGKTLPGIDLSPVQGKVIEITLASGKRILAAVSAFDSDAKRAGNDLMFMVCCEACGQRLREAVAAELAARK